MADEYGDYNMKVLMYGWEFPPFISGGLGIACYGITCGLNEQNVKIALVLPQDVHDKETNDWTHIKTIYVNSPIRPYITPKGYSQLQENQSTQNTNPSQYGSDLLSEVHRYAEVASSLAHDISHDIIHTHDWLTILAGVKAKKISGKPLIYHVHALEPDRNGIHVYQAIYDIEKYGMQQADKIIAVSQYTKNIICKQYGIADEKVEVIHNGIFSSQLNQMNASPQEKRNTILFLGRTTFQKGPFHFINIANRLLQIRRDIEFIVAGNGDLLEDMIRYVARLRIGLHVHFSGFLNRDDVIRIYQMSKVYVMPSVSEPFGITCLEAISYGVPAVISKNSGVAEVMPQVLKADFWDTQKMADQINTLLNHANLRTEQLECAKNILHELLWSNVGKKISNLYKRLLGK